MKTSQEYIAETKKKLGITSDYALAKWLGVTKQAASNWSTGKNGLDDYAAARIAEALGLPAIEVIAAANREREKDEKRKQFWENFSRGTAAVWLYLSIFQTGDVPNQGVTAPDNLSRIYIMRSSVMRRIRQLLARAPGAAPAFCH